jgi:hypothetical protein
MDSFKNFASTTVVIAPAPMAAGRTFTVEDPTVFPPVPFSATAWLSTDPAATVDNSETVRVTAISGKTLTVARAQEGSVSIKIWPGFNIAQLPTKLFYQSIADGAVATAVPQAVAAAVAVAVPQAVTAAGVETGEALQDLFDYSGASPQPLGTATPGTGSLVARREHVHQMPKLDDTAAPDDNTDRNATTTAHGLLLKAVAPAAGVRNVVCIDNTETAYKNAALVDSTNPADVGAVAPGTSLLAARRDHVHAIPTGHVTLAMQANLAQDQFIGRITASTGVPETATITAAARTVLDDATVGDMLTTLGGFPAGGGTVSGNLTVTGTFGCNGKPAQSSYTLSGGALPGYVSGVFGLDSSANMAALHQLVVDMRAALVANGIVV